MSCALPSGDPASHRNATAASTAGVAAAARLTGNATSRSRACAQVASSVRLTSTNAPSGPTNATASMLHTKAAETSIVPCHCEPLSPLATEQAASTSVSHPTNSPLGASSRIGTAAPSTRRAAATATLGRASLRATATG